MKINDIVSTKSLSSDTFVYSGERIVLRRLRDVKTLYHGTSTARLDAIRQSGLRGDIIDRSYPTVDEQGIYLGDSPGRVEQYANRSARKFGGNPIILKIDVSQLQPSAFEADRDYYRGLKQFHTRFCNRKIKGSENIQCDNVDLSLTMLHSVVYHFPIPPGAISVV